MDRTSAQKEMSKAGFAAETKLELPRDISSNTQEGMPSLSRRSHGQHEERFKKCILSGYVRAKLP